MLRNTDARFLGPVTMARVRAVNPDGGYPFVSRQVSMVGPFNFSAAAVPAAVTITAKTDNGSEVADTVDLSGVGSIAAVTAAELAAAITASAVTNLTSAVEAGTGRVKLSLTTPASAKYLQIGGEVAKFAGFGYGFGTQFTKIETVQSLAQEAVQKESERLEVLDSAGRPTAIITRSYRTGSTLTLVDTAFDINIRAKLEGGSFRDDGYTDDAYIVPGPNDPRPTIEAEWFHGVYAKDDNQEDTRVGYLWMKCRNAKLTQSPGTAGDRNVQTGTYTLAVTPYKDPLSSLADEKDTIMQFLTVSEYDALHVLSV